MDSYDSKTKPAFVLLALNSKLADEVKEIQCWLPDCRVEQLIGCWMGQEENSYMVMLSEDPFHQWQQLETIKELARAYDQECVLFVDETREAYRVDTMAGNQFGRRLRLGYFKAVPEWVAKASVAYTYSPRLDAYFLAA